MLPFQNLSAEGPHAYFAGGLHDEILTQLSKVAALKVISRTSVMGYAGPNVPPLRQIASELAVGSVVEGSVQVVGGRLRVNVQLIDAATDAHIWAERYDRTLDDAFAIQSDVAQRIVAAVGAAVTGAERQELVEAPTANAGAYRFYLKGSQYFARGLGDPTILLAAQMYDSAVALDPRFALAYAALAKAHARGYFQEYDRSEARASRAKAAAEQALLLQPGLPEAHEALGWYNYWVVLDWNAAMAQFAAALKGRPNSSEIQLGLGLSYRRLGHFDDALRALERARELDPLSSGNNIEVGISLMFARRYQEAVDALRRATRLAPDHHRGYAHFAAAFVARDGNLDSAVHVLRSGAMVIGEAPFVNRVLDPNNTAEIRWLLPDLFPAAFAHLSHQELGPRLLDYYVTLAEWHWKYGRAELQRAYGDSALLIAPGNALALGHAGRRQEALRAARTALDDKPVDRDWRGAGARLHRLARLFAIMGENRAALELLERWAIVASDQSAAMLRFDPAWKAIRADRRFQRIAERR